MARPKGSKNKNKLQLSPDEKLSPDHVAEVKQKANQSQNNRKRKTETKKIEDALNAIRRMIEPKRTKPSTTKSSDDYNVGYTFPEPLAGNGKTPAELAKIALEIDPSRDRSIGTTETYAKARLKRAKESQ